MHCIHDLIALFDACFFKKFNTRLVYGGEEPIYIPQSDMNPYHRIVFTQDYFASALHEVAHWCVAGAGRRDLLDYGYWYAPDGRSAAQQLEFESVEVKPQALECLFAEAAGLRFRVSADNLNLGLGASTNFKQKILQQVKVFCADGLPSRANTFVQALTAFYATGNVLSAQRYSLERFD